MLTDPITKYRVSSLSFFYPTKDTLWRYLVDREYSTINDFEWSKECEIPQGNESITIFQSKLNEKHT